MKGVRLLIDWDLGYGRCAESSRSFGPLRHAGLSELMLASAATITGRVGESSIEMSGRDCSHTKRRRVSRPANNYSDSDSDLFDQHRLHFIELCSK